MRILFEKISHYYFIIIFISIFCIKSGYSVFFDGLPWVNIYELMAICIFIPVILFFKNNYLFKNFYIKLLILIFFFIKSLLSLVPENGISYKQYVDNNYYNQNIFLKSYDTFWNKNFSAIQKTNWTSKKHFPIDFDFTSKSNFKIKNNKNTKIYKDHKEYNNLKLIYKINFFLVLDKSYQFTLLNKGVSENSFLNFKELQKLDRQQIKFNEKVYLKKGIYEFDSKFIMEGSDWSIIPLLENVNNKKNKYPFQNIFYELNKSKLYLVKLSFFKYLAYFLDIGLCLTLLFFSLYRLFKNYYIFFLAVIFSVAIIFFNYFIKLFYQDVFGTLGFSFSLFFLILAILVNKIKVENLKINDFLFIITFPIIIIFFNKFSYLIEVYNFLDEGNDWVAFENFAREIVVDGKWLEAGELIFWFRPGARYIYAIHHIIFGKSMFSIYFFDVWFLLGIVFILIKILINFKISIKYSVLGGMLLLFFYLGDNFRWTIGRGLSEWIAAYLLLLSMFLIITLNKYKHFFILFLFIILISILHSWVREEHIFSILGSILLYNYNKTSNFLFKDFYNNLKINFKIIFLYCLLVSSGFLLIFIRNYYLGGSFGLDHPSSNYYASLNISWYENTARKFWVLLTGTANWSYKIPRVYSILLLCGFLISIFSFFNTNIFKQINNLGLIIVIFCMYFPFIVFDNIGYPPRYSIHILPISIAIILIYYYPIIIKVENLIKNKKFIFIK